MKSRNCWFDATFRGRIKLIVPKTREALSHFTNDILFLSTFLPVAYDNFLENILVSTPYIILFVLETDGRQIVLAISQIEPSTFSSNSAELHGIIRQDIKHVFSKRYALPRLILPLLFSYLYLGCGYETLVVTEEDNNKVISVFARSWRFQKVSNTPRRYCLTRAQYYSREN